MWYYIFKNYRPQNVLEIGIYRGQTLSLFQLLSDHFNIGSNVVGISPLTAAGDSKSSYIELDYEKDILENFDRFNLKHPKLVRSFSTMRAKSLPIPGGWTSTAIYPLLG